MNKRIFTLLFISVFLFAYASAQETNGYYKKKYKNISFTTTTLRQNDGPDLKSNFGAAITIGRTFFLHKKPIANMLRFGIDATWFDLNYTNYKIEYLTDYEPEKYDYHQAEISMQIGPSIVLNPVKKLNIHAYFRYAPTYSALVADEEFYGNYATLFVGGASVSYGAIGVGIESRFGKCTYKNFESDEYEDEHDYEYEDEGNSLKTKLRSWRAYITFRF